MFYIVRNYDQSLDIITNVCIVMNGRILFARQVSFVVRVGDKDRNQFFLLFAIYLFICLLYFVACSTKFSVSRLCSVG
jgi:hypothetical protein